MKNVFGLYMGNGVEEKMKWWRLSIVMKIRCGL